jgi:hypothetical protein
MLPAQHIFLEIATQLTIDPDLTIRHALYPAWPVPELVSKRLQDSPREIQAKFLGAQLQVYLHRIYFSRAIQKLAATESVVSNAAILTNDTVQGIDTAFYAQIDQANCSQGYADVDWIIEGEEEDGLVAIVKDGLRLHIWPTHICPDYQTLAVGDLATIVMPKNLLTIDRYIAVSNYGRVRQLSLINLYFSCPPAVAIEVIAKITSVLNTLGLPFELQVQLEPHKYQQTDGLILQLSAADYATARMALHEIYHQHQGQFHDQTPSFTTAIATGVGLSHLATNPQGVLQLWQVVAQALAEIWLLKIADDVVKFDRLWQALLQSDSDIVAFVT